MITDRTPGYYPGVRLVPRHTVSVLRARVLSAFLASVAVASCAGDRPGPDAGSGSFTTAPGAEVGLELTEVASGLTGPTQIAHDGSGGFVVAELNGGEREGTGRIVRYAALPGESEIVLDGLTTPTGVAVEQGLLWVMERRTLSVGPLDDPTDRTIVLDDLPFNGRSQGTISPVARGGILFNTSGRQDGTSLADGSGVLWYLESPDGTPVPFATGFKHAYAHAPIAGDRWLVTEISDGRLDGVVPPDEVVVAEVGDDFGYPQCVGDRRPVAETGGSSRRCASTPASAALLEPGSTPTGIAVAPWDPTLVVIALWNRGELAVVRLADPVRPGEVDVVLAAFDRPQHLLVDGRRILVTDHATGLVVAIERPPGPS